jgi:WD repeat-containing protein 19
MYTTHMNRKVPILGKHSKGIVCCAWSWDNSLALGTANNLISINTIEGDAIKTFLLREEPSDIKFGEPVGEDSVSTGSDDSMV